MHLTSKRNAGAALNFYSKTWNTTISVNSCFSLSEYKEPEGHLGLIRDNIKKVHSLFQEDIFKTFLRTKGKIVNALQVIYSNAKIEKR